MNKAEVILKVSEKSGINEEDCGKVLNAFEVVLSERLSDSISGAFYKTYSMTSFIKSKKNNN